MCDNRLYINQTTVTFWQTVIVDFDLYMYGRESEEPYMGTLYMCL